MRGGSEARQPGLDAKHVESGPCFAPRPSINSGQTPNAGKGRKIPEGGQAGRSSGEKPSPHLTTAAQADCDGPAVEGVQLSGAVLGEHVAVCFGQC